MPTKTWADGDIPSGADFNTYFRDQVVTTCTSGTRPSTSVDGRMIYETDTTRYYRWSTASASWVLAVGQGSHNVIPNGNFSVAQRGTGPFTTAGAYSLDCIRPDSNGTTFSATRQTFAPGGIAGAQEGGYYYRTVVTSVAGAGNYNNFAFRIEGAHTFAGQGVTLSFYAKADATKSVALELAQIFGTGGSPSAEVDTSGGKVTLTTTWTRYTVTATLPSIAGKTLGANGDDFLGVNFWLDAGSTFNSRSSTLGQQSGTFEFAMVQLEAGGSATLFEYEPPQTTLIRCQRYFASLPAFTYLGSSVGTTDAYFAVPLPAAMRALPSLTVVGGLTNAVSEIGGVLRTPTSVVIGWVATNCLVVAAGGMTGLTWGRACVFGNVIQLSAEL